MEEKECSNCAVNGPFHEYSLVKRAGPGAELKLFQCPDCLITYSPSEYEALDSALEVEEEEEDEEGEENE